MHILHTPFGIGDLMYLELLDYQIIKPVVAGFINQNHLKIKNLAGMIYQI